MKWTDTWAELIGMLRLRSDPVAFKRFGRAEDLDIIPNIYRPPHLFTFCQAVFLARVQKLTVGVTKKDKMNYRCQRIHGVRNANEVSMQSEAEMLSTTWFGTVKEALQQQIDTPRVPAAEAIALSPLPKEKFDPEVILIFGNPAQIMMLLCGLQKERYRRFEFYFTGEGACADSLGECFRTGKPQLSLPCYGERSMGQVADDEISLALPPDDLPRAISGMKKLAKVGFKYPINFIGAQADLEPILSQIYPAAFKKQESG